jgi:hypothetical protein
MENQPISYRPAACFLRESIRESETLEGCKQVAMWAVDEIELLKEQLREIGEVPRRKYEASMIGPDGRILSEQEAERRISG